MAINIISNSFTSHDSSTINAIIIQPTFNPLDKVVELYERLLQSKREKVELLKSLRKYKEVTGKRGPVLVGQFISSGLHALASPSCL